MGYKHDRESILDGAIELAYEAGVSALTFGALGRRLGIADRTIVYYFPWKAKLIEAVVDAIATDMDEVLRDAVGEAPRPASGFVADVWPRLGGPRLDAVAPVYLEILGVAATGRQPYAGIVSVALHERVTWLTGRIVTDADPIAMAGALLAVLDGLIATRVLRGAGVADAAVVAGAF